MILPTPEESELVKANKMKKILKFAPSRLLKSPAQDDNQGKLLIFTVDVQK